MHNNKNRLLYLTDKQELKKKRQIIKFFEELKDEIICFLDNEENIKIFSSICPHFGGEIYYDIKNSILRCKWHDWKFCKNTGKCLNDLVNLQLNSYELELNPDKLKRYKSRLEDDKIFIIYE